jgi:hypothetical protein
MRRLIPIVVGVAGVVAPNQSGQANQSHNERDSHIAQGLKYRAQHLVLEVLDQISELITDLTDPELVPDKKNIIPFSIDELQEITRVLDLLKGAVGRERREDWLVYFAKRLSNYVKNIRNIKAL